MSPAPQREATTLGQRVLLTLGPLALAMALLFGGASFVGAALAETSDDQTGLVSLGALGIFVASVFSLITGLVALAWGRRHAGPTWIAAATIAAALLLAMATPTLTFVFFFATTPWWGPG